MKYKVRELEECDISQVAQLEKALFTDSWSEKSIRDSWQQTNVKMIVAAVEGQVLGYHIFYQALDEGDVARIAVDSNHRRMGIGEQLLEYMWDYCRNSGVERVLLEVRESNESAITLYKKHGFVSLGIRRNYYQEPLEHGVIMEKQIDITTSN